MILTAVQGNNLRFIFKIATEGTENTEISSLFSLGALWQKKFVKGATHTVGGLPYGLNFHQVWAV